MEPINMDLSHFIDSVDACVQICSNNLLISNYIIMFSVIATANERMTIKKYEEMRLFNP